MGRGVSRKAMAATAVLGFWATGAFADIKLGDLFSDHMVLPRHGAVVFGEAKPGETLTIGFGDATQKTKADAKGAFRATLPDLTAGQTANLTLSGSSGAKLEVADVIAGDVFLCSGQSNMQLQVRRSLNADSVIRSSANENLRMLTVTLEAANAPLTHFKTPVKWEKAGPERVGEWSGACYFFGDALYQKTGVPVGMVNSSFGGSNIRAWIDAKTLSSIAEQKTNLETLKLYAEKPEAAGAVWGKAFEAWWQANGGPVTPRAPWASTPEDLKGWKAVPDVSLNWEKWGIAPLSRYDGALWYAKTFTLTEAQAKLGGQLDLGTIDEIDQTWLNGVPVGYQSGAGTLRHYAVPKSGLKAGENVIIINVLDTWAYGGMYGKSEPRQLKLEDGSAVPLEANWVYNDVPPKLASPPRAPWDATGGVTILSNAMINPMGPFGFKAALWYQGESNTGEGLGYLPYMQALMRDWRARFSPDLGFALIQLANYGPKARTPQKSGWAEVREAQRLAALNDHRATVVTAVDIGDPYDIHPANKPELGRRLARAIGVKFYGMTGQSESGPVIGAVKRTPDAIEVTFKGVEGILAAYGAAEPLGFELCEGADQACTYAQGVITKPDTVELRLGEASLKAIKLVRYCWADSPVCTLADNKNDLPAIPFQQAVP